MFATHVYLGRNKPGAPKQLLDKEFPEGRQFGRLAHVRAVLVARWYDRDRGERERWRR
jgi:hypothetical protein